MNISSNTLSSILNANLAATPSQQAAPQTQALLRLLTAPKPPGPVQRQDTLVSATLQLHQSRPATSILPTGSLFPTLPTSRRLRPARTNKVSKKNLRLLILVRILSKDLSRPEDVALKNQLKQLVRECNRRHKNGDPQYSPLSDAIERVLRTAVGEARWLRVTQRLDAMMLQRHQRLLQC